MNSYCAYFVDPSVDIQSLDIQVNAVATALKGFFNDLMEALLPSTLINELTEASGKLNH